MEIFWGLLWTNLGLIRKVSSLGHSLTAELGMGNGGFMIGLLKSQSGRIFGVIFRNFGFDQLGLD